jgi:hypothetical protein
VIPELAVTSPLKFEILPATKPRLLGIVTAVLLTVKEVFPPGLSAISPPPAPENAILLFDTVDVRLVPISISPPKVAPPSLEIPAT